MSSNAVEEKDMSASWLSRDRDVGIGVFVAALTIRLLHLIQISRLDPYFLNPAVDGTIYHEWAQRIASGDWVGEGVLIMGPLYPYLMGLMYSFTGPDLMVWKIVQAVLGALSCLLVWRLAREVFDRRVALIAASLAVFFEMLIFYGGTVMVVNVQVPLVLSVVLMTMRALRLGGVSRWLTVGILIGLSGLARQTMLLYLPVVCVSLWFSMGSLTAKSFYPARVRFLAALLVGVTVILLPFTIRNLIVADDFVVVNSTGGINLYMGNNEHSDGRWRPPRIGRGRVDTPVAMQETFSKVAEERLERELSPSEVSRYWSGQALDFVVSDPSGWMKLEARKFLLFFNANEVWNNRSIEISRPFSSILSWSFLDLGIVIPLGVLGMGLAVRRWRELFPLYGLVFVYLTSIMVFFMVSRYRMPAVPILMIFSAYSLVWFFDSVRGTNFRSLLAACFALIILIPVSRLDLAVPDSYMAYFNLGNRYRENGDHDRAIESYEEALRQNSGFTSTLNNLALIYQEVGRTDEAGEIWQNLYQRAVKTRDVGLLKRSYRRLRSLGLEPINTPNINDSAPSEKRQSSPD